MNAISNVFKNRRHAGRELASALACYAGRTDLVVIGLPRGGVPVAFEVAQALEVPLDVLVVRKLRLPGREDLVMGAVSCGGVRVLNDSLISRQRITQRRIEAVAARELNELHRCEIAFRGCTGAPSVADKTVILVDDGIATGASILAAVRVVRAEEPCAIVIAVPVASVDAAELLKPEVEDFVSLQTPVGPAGVAGCYENFDQPSDVTVKRLLAESRVHAQPPD
jgi:putative phosphoribosyl transferase